MEKKSKRLCTGGGVLTNNPAVKAGQTLNDFPDDEWDDDGWDDSLIDNEISQMIIDERPFNSNLPVIDYSKEGPSTISTNKPDFIKDRFSCFDNAFAKGSDSKTSNPSILRSSSSSTGKYNCIPIKITKSPVKASSYITGKITSNSKNVDHNDLSKELNDLRKEFQKLKEENAIKVGEVNNLRTEKKRKEALLDSERIERCHAIELAEKRGREKGAKALSELEEKFKDSRKMLEKTQAEIAFKNREVEEMTNKCLLIEKNGNQSSKLVAPASRLQNGRQKGTTNSNFDGRFNFEAERRKVSSKTIETQTEHMNVKKKRHFIDLGSFSSRGTTCRFRGENISNVNHSNTNQTQMDQIYLSCKTQCDDYSNAVSLLLLEKLNLEKLDGLTVVTDKLNKLIKETCENDCNEGLEESVYVDAISSTIDLLTYILSQKDLEISSTMRPCLSYLNVIARRKPVMNANLFNQMKQTLLTSCSKIMSDSKMDFLDSVMELVLSLVQNTDFSSRLCGLGGGGCLLLSLSQTLKCCIERWRKINCISSSLPILHSSTVMLMEIVNDPPICLDQMECQCICTFLEICLDFSDYSLNFLLESKDVDDFDTSAFSFIPGIIRILCSLQLVHPIWTKVVCLPSYILLISILTNRGTELKDRGIINQHMVEFLSEL